MFYFESIKIQADSFTSPYALTIKFEKIQPYFVTANNIEWLNNIFNFTKNKKYYKNGSWFINEYNLSDMDNNNFKSFINKNITFCDENLIINKSWTVKKTIDFYKSFFKKNNEDITELLNIFSIEKYLFNVKLKELSNIDLIRIMLCLSSFKEGKYLICNFIDYKLNKDQSNELIELTNTISNNLQKMLIVFLDNKNEHIAYINLESKDFLHFNKLLTLGEAKFEKQKILSKQHLSKFIYIYSIMKYEFFCLFLTNLLIMFGNVFMLSVTKINTTNTSLIKIINYIEQYPLIWNIISYSLYVFIFINIIFWWLVMNKKINKYNNFLNNLGTNLLLNSLIWPFSLIITISIGVVVSFIGTQIIFSITSKNIDKLWFVLCLFLYMICYLILIIVSSFKVNQFIKQITFKETLIKIISN